MPDTNNMQKPLRSLPSIQTVNDNGEISKKDLRLVKQRFLNLHKFKMQRALDAITPRQKIFLELLPLLFHVNHPVLPGYISSKTPAGIADYSPTKLSIEKAKKLSKGFVYSKRARRVFGIESLFLMGSVGSIAYAKGSDMDLWLCHAPSLSAKELELLQKKASDIEKWADTLGLEVHFFLMDAEAFKYGAATPLSSESSGSTQHHLLLEEFYRTALYVAGRYPVWWLVPPEAEKNYQTFVDNLLTQRFIERHDVIDFGGLESVPAEEFLGAAFWHLYKAIDSPYKSLLKLMLMEAYVDQYPDPTWSALRMKQLVYSGESDVNKLDAYLILYAALEDYFIKRNEPDRLNLMRYCFYNKLNEHGLLVTNSSKKDWRQEVVAQMLKSWEPLPDYLTHALTNKAWDILQVQQEKERLTKELTHSYRLLMQFAKERVTRSKRDSDELTLLGRKLNATFERQPSKLERSTIKNIRMRQEVKVLLKNLSQVKGQARWVLKRQDDGLKEQFIRQSHSLIELLGWCVDYGVLGDMTKIALDPGSSHITAREVTQTLRSVSVFFKTLPKKPADLEVYRYKPVVTNVMLVINSGIDSMRDYTDQGINLTSTRSDALSFGSQRYNLIHSVDMMLRNSWNEILVGKQEGVAGLMTSLCDVFDYKTLGQQQVLPSLVCVSYNSPRAMSVSKRVQQLFKEIAVMVKGYSPLNSPRLVIQTARSFCILQVHDRKLTFSLVAEADLAIALAAPQAVYSPIYFDSFNDQKSILPVICGRHKEGAIRVYYIALAEERAQIYIIDEQGAIYTKEADFVNEENFLRSYKELLDSILHRRRLAAYEDDAAPFNEDVEYYRAEKKGLHWEFVEVKLSDNLTTFGMDIRVAFDEILKELSIYCNDKMFSSLGEGDQFYGEAAAYIRKARHTDQSYPVYVSDIDVPNKELGTSDSKTVQIVSFLNYKDKIEAKLNI